MPKLFYVILFLQIMTIRIAISNSGRMIYDGNSRITSEPTISIACRLKFNPKNQSHMVFSVGYPSFSLACLQLPHFLFEEKSKGRDSSCQSKDYPESLIVQMKEWNNSTSHHIKPNYNDQWYHNKVFNRFTDLVLAQGIPLIVI